MWYCAASADADLDRGLGLHLFRDGTVQPDSGLGVPGSDGGWGPSPHSQCRASSRPSRTRAPTSPRLGVASAPTRERDSQRTDCPGLAPQARAARKIPRPPELELERVLSPRHLCRAPLGQGLGGSGNCSRLSALLCATPPPPTHPAPPWPGQEGGRRPPCVEQGAVSGPAGELCEAGRQRKGQCS